MVKLRKQTGYGRARLSRELWHRSDHKLQLSPNTIRHILRRQGLVKPRRRRKVCYPLGLGDQQALRPGDVQDIRDEATLGPRLVHHWQQAHLPRYQWTFLEGRTRLRPSAIRTR